MISGWTGTGDRNSESESGTETQSISKLSLLSPLTSHFPANYPPFIPKYLNYNQYFMTKTFTVMSSILSILFVMSDRQRVN